MKPKFEIQVKIKRWRYSQWDILYTTKKEKIRFVKTFGKDGFRVVQKLGNKIVKVVYPKKGK